jgi:hypothetical protein
MYEEIVETLLAEAYVEASTVAGVAGRVIGADPEPDQAALGRIRRERERAVTKCLRDRDAATLERTMAQLDAEQTAAETRDPVESIPADVAVRYVRELPETWRKAEGGKGRQLLAGALFDRIDVLGLSEATVHLSAHAVRHGLATALPEELRISGNGRGERSRADTFRVVVHVDCGVAQGSEVQPLRLAHFGTTASAARCDATASSGRAASRR